MEIRELVVRDLVTVGPTHTLAQAAQRMTERKVGAAVVLLDESPGIISERDVMRAIAEGADPATATVGDYMTWSAIVCTSEWDTLTAARTMMKHGIRHLVVMDGVDQIGILSIRDLVVGLLDRLPDAGET